MMFCIENMDLTLKCFSVFCALLRVNLWCSDIEVYCGL
jgi:hypothetical protein